MYFEESYATVFVGVDASIAHGMLTMGVSGRLATELVGADKLVCLVAIRRGGASLRYSKGPRGCRGIPR